MTSEATQQPADHPVAEEVAELEAAVAAPAAPEPTAPAPAAPRARLPWLWGFLAVAAVVVVGINLRAGIASAAPLYPDLQALLGYGPLVASLLPTIPVLCFAFAGAATAWLVRRAGLERAIALAMFLLAAGLAVRAVESTGLLLAGTVIGMSGLAVCNVAMPSFIRQYHARRTPVMTGTYTITMSVGATAAAAVAVPVAAQVGSPTLGLAAWAVPALAGLLLFLPMALRAGRARRARATGAAVPAHVSPWPMLATRKGLLFTGLFAVQALMVYAIMSWLPTVLIARGLSAAAAGFLLGLMQVVSIPTVVVLLWMAARPRLLRPAFLATCVASLAGFTTLLVVPAAFSALPAVLLGMGFCVFPLIMLQISRTGGSAEETTALSTLAQSLGYLIAAAGPFGFGLLGEAVGGWTVPLVVLLAFSVVQLVLGYLISGPAVAGPRPGPAPAAAAGEAA